MGFGGSGYKPPEQDPLAYANLSQGQISSLGGAYQPAPNPMGQGTVAERQAYVGEELTPGLNPTDIAASYQPPPGYGGSQPAGGQPMTFGDFDMSKAQIDESVPGTIAQRLLDRDSRGDQWSRENPDAFSTPGQLETFWDGVSGGWNNRPEATTLAVDAYNKYEANRNELAPLPGLDPYYDRARERTSADLNRQLAARGGYNSSRGLGILSDATQGLNAEQANREADYALARSADARAWGIGGSQAANLADSSTRGAGQLDLQQMLGYGELAGAAQGAGQGRLLTDLGVDMGLDAQEFGDWAGAVDAASTAGGARRDRIGQLFDDMFGLGATSGSMAGANYDASISDILSNIDAELAAELGLDTFALGRQDMGRQGFTAELGALLEMLSKAGGSGGGVAGGSPTGGGAGIR